MTHRGVYAHRFNRRVTIERPLPAPPSMHDLTDDEFARFLATLHPASAAAYSFSQAMAKAWPGVTR